MDIRETVNTWAAERLRGGPLATFTPAYNQVHAALPDLIARLGGGAPAEPEPEPSPEAAPDAAAEAPEVHPDA